MCLQFDVVLNFPHDCRMLFAFFFSHREMSVELRAMCACIFLTASCAVGLQWTVSELQLLSFLSDLLALLCDFYWLSTY